MRWMAEGQPGEFNEQDRDLASAPHITVYDDGEGIDSTSSPEWLAALATGRDPAQTEGVEFILVRPQGAAEGTTVRRKAGHLITRDKVIAHVTVGHNAAGLVDEEIIIERAIQVIGDRDKALRWFGTPVHALRYATPISLLGSDEGQQAVLTVLGRLEHGVF